MPPAIQAIAQRPVTYYLSGSNADVVEPGSDDPDQAAEIEACVELSERLRTLRPA